MAHSVFKDIQLKKDGSYVCEYNGAPYHIPNGYGYEDKWAEVTAHLLIYPEDVREYEEPVHEPLTGILKTNYTRHLRNIRIEKIEKAINRYLSQEKAGLPTTDTEEWYYEALLYLEELRHVPEQEGFPDNVIWPEHPDHKVYGIEEEDPYRPY